MGERMMPAMDGMAGGMMLWMLLWGLVGLAVLVSAVAGVIVLVRRSRRDDAVGPQHPDAAVEELRRRLAEGEIDEEEYLRRRSALE